jgi:hypothetical protein
MEPSSVGKWIFLAGLAVAALGLLVIIAAKSGIPLESLPGDVKIERRGFSLYVPIVTMIILSAILTIVANLVIRLFRR